MNNLTTIATAAIALSAGAAFGQAINISSPGGTGVNGSQSFVWQGLTFTLNDQPSGAPTSAHRVSGTSTGEIDFFLEEPGTVSYRATISPSTTLPTDFSLGFRYGEDLTASTPSFSNLNTLFRRIDSGNEITQQLLAGSDISNPNSVFYGSTGRAANETGGLNNQAFLNNVPLGTDGLFEMRVFPSTGDAATSVTAAGVMGSADFTRDMNAAGLSPDPFTFNEIILQVQSFQDSTSFGQQFGQTGQKFTYTNLDIVTVPTPGAAGLLGIAGIAATRRRR
jgi:hypothetical protein